MRLSGFNELREKLDESRFQVLMYGLLGRLGAMMEEDSNGYPPQPKPRNPRRKAYRRTGRLGASLTTEVVIEPEIYAVRLGSNVVYSPLVWALPDDEPIGQAWMHQGVWTPLATSVLDNIDKYAEYAESEIYLYLEGG
jgi:hypothetical protein